MIDLLNCPNCGAPITSDHCEYCGSVFYDWASIDTDKASFVKIKHRDRYIWLKVIMDDLSVQQDTDEVLYADDRIFHRVARAPTFYQISANFHTVPFDGPCGPNTLAVIKKGQTYDRSYC